MCKRVFWPLLFILASSFLIASAQADTLTWDDGVVGSFTSKNNWTPSRTPAAGDDLQLFVNSDGNSVEAMDNDAGPHHGGYDSLDVDNAGSIGLAWMAVQSSTFAVGSLTIGATGPSLYSMTGGTGTATTTGLSSFGQFLLADDSRFTAATFTASGGSIQFQNTSQFNATTFTMNSGTLETLDSSQFSVSTFNMSGGSVQLTGTSSLTLTGTLTQILGSVQLGNGNFINNGTYDYEGGDISGKMVNNGTFICHHVVGTYGLGDFQNLGTFIFRASPLPPGSLTSIYSVENTGCLIVQSSTLFDSINNHGSIVLQSTLNVNLLNNFGTVLENHDVTVTSFNLSGGTWDLQSGSLNVMGGMFLGGGSANLGAGATFIMDTTGTFDLSHLSIMGIGATGGDGTFIQNAGTFLVKGFTIGGGAQNSTHPQHGFYILNNGSLISSGSIIVAGDGATGGSFVQNNGYLTATAGLTINLDDASAATFAMNGGTADLRSTKIVNNGAFTQTAGVIYAGEINGVGSIALSGNGSLNAGQIRQTSVSLSGSSQIGAPIFSFTNPVNRVQSLTFATSGNTISGRWDLANGHLIVDYSGASPIADIRKDLASGYAGGAWTGNGLATSMSAGVNKKSLGYAEASAVLGGSGGVFEGVQVDGTAVLVKFTYAGDSNLDGKVDVSDLGALASNWQKSGDWLHGDFNYDSSVNVTDLGLLASNWQAGADNPLAENSFQQALVQVGLASTFVPEPAMLCGSLTFLFLGLANRRRS